MKAAEQPRPATPPPGRAEVWHGRAMRAYALGDGLRRRAPRLVAVLRILTDTPVGKKGK